MPIRAILSGLVAEQSPCVKSVVFCDEEGERVEAVTRDPGYDPYEIDLMGASYCAIARAIQEDSAGLRVVHAEGVVHLRLLIRGYYVVALAERDGAQWHVDRGLSRVGEALIEHM